MKPVIIIAIAFVLLIPLSAFAQSYTGVLKLDSIPSNFKEGGIITFSGTLTTTDGRVVSDAAIYIKDDIDFGRDAVIGTVTTDKNGKFSATWKAVPRSSGSYDFYAIYEGGSSVSKARSVTYTVTVSSTGTSSSSSYSASTSYTPTKITLDRFVNSAKIGQIITFSGTLTANGKGLANAVVEIKDEDLGDRNDFLTSATTDSTGKFSVNWKVRNTESTDRQFTALILDLYGGFGGATQLNHLYNIAEANTVEIYAEFKGNNQYSKSKTCLIENVDGVLQENCYNKILSIQDDSSFENLIMSMVLSEMGVGTDSLESILTNQADSTDAANFEDFLLEALQDELDLGDTDLSMQEMLDLLEDPSLAVNYNTVQSYTPTTVPKSTPKATTNLDYDGDGIPDYRDECMYIKENYNGYEDTDGCLDFKPLEITPTIPSYDIKFKQKQEAEEKQERLNEIRSNLEKAEKEREKQEQVKQLKEAQSLQDQAYKNLNDLKRSAVDAEDSLIQLGSETPEQKKIIDKAWKLLKLNKKTLNDVEEQFQKGDRQFGADYYENSKTWYNLKEKDSQKFENNLKDISKLIEKVEKLQTQTCFLWWCW